MLHAQRGYETLHTCRNKGTQTPVNPKDRRMMTALQLIVMMTTVTLMIAMMCVDQGQRVGSTPSSLYPGGPWLTAMPPTLSGCRLSARLHTMWCLLVALSACSITNALIRYPGMQSNHGQGQPSGRRHGKARQGKAISYHSWEHGRERGTKRNRLGKSTRRARRDLTRALQNVLQLQPYPIVPMTDCYHAGSLADLC